MTKQVNLGDSYKTYQSLVDKPVPKAVYLKIVYGLFKAIVQVMFAGYTVRLGARLGVVGVKGKKSQAMIVDNPDGTQTIKGLAPNWAETKRIWQVEADKMGLQLHEYTAQVPRENRPQMAYCFNEHSNGIVYNLNWYKEFVAVGNKTYYCLLFSWHNKRAFSALVKGGKEYEVDDYKSTIKPSNQYKNGQLKTQTENSSQHLYKSQSGENRYAPKGS